MILRRILLLALVLMISGTGLAYGLSTAQPVMSLTTSPVTISLPIKPGSSYGQTLQVMNNTSLPIPITMEVKTFGANGTSGQAAINNLAISSPEASWIHFSPSTFIAKPKVWSYVKATISLPQSASLGYYFAIVFQPTYAKANKPGVAHIIASNAILMLIDTRSANEQRQLQIANYSISHRIYEYLPAYFSVNVHNQGNIYLSPTGDIFISRNSNGFNSIGTLPVNPGSGNILPHSNRVFVANWTNGDPVYRQKLNHGQPIFDKNGQPIMQLDWNLNHIISNFRFGEYYAHLVLTYNNGTRQIILNSTIPFWVIPWKLILIVL